MISFDQNKTVVLVLVDHDFCFSRLDKYWLYHIWRTFRKASQFRFPYRMFYACCLVFHTIQILALLLLICGQVHLVPILCCMELAIISMLMKHRYQCYWILAMDQKCSTSLENMEHWIADIRQWMTENWW